MRKVNLKKIILDFIRFQVYNGTLEGSECEWAFKPWYPNGKRAISFSLRYNSLSLINYI